MMKYLYIIVAGIILTSCENRDIEFPDYDYNAVYFPLQFPVRTLSLGYDDRIDNSLDLELKFHIGVSIGGIYENKSNWTMDYVVDESLAEGIHYNGDTLEALPSNYYTLNPVNQVSIPSGSFSGLIEVQLTEDFLDNPKALMTHYVIPLVITNTNADSILTGIAAVPNPDKRIVTDWAGNRSPKDFVLFGIKYVNKMHGKWLRRGAITPYLDGQPIKSADGVSDSLVHYRQLYVEQDAVMTLKTAGRDEAITNGVGPNISDGGNSSMKLIADEVGNIQVVSAEGSKYIITTGEGKHVLTDESNEEWGGFKRQALYLNYEYLNEDSLMFFAYDTLVFRDRAISFETFYPELIE